MLVLTRREGESIRIGDDVLVTVFRTGTGSVKFGVKAPAGVRVLRTELEPFDGSKPLLPRKGEPDDGSPE